MKEYTEAERMTAETQVCIGGCEAGVAFFGRHPELGFGAAVHMQCELNEAALLIRGVLQSPAMTLAQRVQMITDMREFLERLEFQR